MHDHQSSLALSWADLVELQATIDARPLRRQSLRPGAPAATSLLDLVQSIATLEERPSVIAAAHIVGEAMIRDFPDNVFCDYDALLSSLIGHAREAECFDDTLLRWALHVAQLFHLYGERSTIRFRYLHDFLYGFDWARWVRNRPDERSDVGPYDVRFLEYSWRRGHELLALIASGDSKYHPVPESSHRNPFEFQRDIESESRLYEALVRIDAIPVLAWERDGVADWTKPYTEIRSERAREMGLSRVL